jgi:esterase/lipase superfamily enzyme
MLLAIGAAVALLLVLLVRIALSDRAETKKRVPPREPMAAPPPPATAGGRAEPPAPASASRPADLERSREAPAAARQPATEHSGQLESMGAKPKARDEHYVVTVHYGTDRNDTQNADPRNRFDERRARPPHGQSPISYGTCEVSIPPDHQVGEMEAPGIFQSWRPEKHVMLLKIDPQTGDVFFDTLRRRIGESTGRKTFIFVHGFSVSFEDAARRTAQMAFDLKFDGPPIFFSWPTEAISLTNLDPTVYTVAGNNAHWATRHFAAFLTDVVRRTGAETVHLIAHSMGNRVVTDALMELFYVLTPEERRRLKEVILSAPDIDADVFIEQIAPRLSSMNERVTLYASTKDAALQAARRVHGYPRIGDLSQVRQVPAGVELVDASEVETDPFGHSYYGNAESVISDICALITSGARAAGRGSTLAAAHGQGLTGTGYWRIRKETKLASVLAQLGRA